MKFLSLVISDQLANRKILNHILVSHCTLINKSSIDEAIDWLSKNESPDVILLDVIVPTINKLDFLYSLHSLKEKKPYVIVFSDTENYIDKINFSNMGAEGYLLKPIIPEELITQIFKSSIL